MNRASAFVRRTRARFAADGPAIEGLDGARPPDVAAMPADPGQDDAGRERRLYDHKARAHFMEARVELERGAFRRARRHFLAAADFGYDRYEVELGVGTAWLGENRIARALERFEAVMQMTMVLPAVHYHAGLAHRLAGNRKAALEHYRIALKRVPDRLTAALTLRELVGLSAVPAGETAKLVGLVAGRAAGEAHEAARADALLLELSGRREEAFLALRAALRARPDSAALARDIALLLADGDPGLAVRALRDAAGRLPRDGEVARALAKALFHAGKNRAAVRAVRRALVLSPAEPSLLANLGNLHARAGRHVAAIRAWREALAARPDCLPALRGLATLHHENGAFDLAGEYYERALAVAGDDAVLHYDYGVLLYEAGDPLRAMRRFRRALDLDPRFKAAEENLRYVLLIRYCYPDAAPEERIDRLPRFWWLGGGAAAALVVISLVQGWFK